MPNWVATVAEFIGEDEDIHGFIPEGLFDDDEEQEAKQ